MNNISLQFKDSLPTSLKDPFSKDCVDAVHIHIYPERSICVANIEFRNANTSGSQRFEEKEFEILVYKVKSFIDAL